MISVTEQLAKRGAYKSTYRCPTCGGYSFHLDQGATAIHLSGDLLSVQPDRVLPVAIIVCNNCGFVSFHATSVLENEAKI